MTDGPLDTLAFTAELLDDRDHADDHGSALLQVLTERGAQLDAVRRYIAELQQPGPDVSRSEIVARLTAAAGDKPGSTTR